MVCILFFFLPIYLLAKNVQRRQGLSNSKVIWRLLRKNVVLIINRPQGYCRKRTDILSKQSWTYMKSLYIKLQIGRYP